MRIRSSSRCYYYKYYLLGRPYSWSRSHGSTHARVSTLSPVRTFFQTTEFSTRSFVALPLSLRGRKSLLEETASSPRRAITSKSVFLPPYVSFSLSFSCVRFSTRNTLNRICSRKFALINFSLCVSPTEVYSFTAGEYVRKRERETNSNYDKYTNEEMFSRRASVFLSISRRYRNRYYTALSHLAIDQTDSWPIICIYPQHTSLIHVYKYKSYASANIGFYGYACIIITMVGASRATINKSRMHAVSRIMRIVE